MQTLYSLMRNSFKLQIYLWNSHTSRLTENRKECVWKPSQRSVKNTGLLQAKMSDWKVKDRCKLVCAGLCNGLNTVRLVQGFATDWTLCGLCRTLQRTEHCASCAGLCNGLNTVRLVQDFAMDWTLCALCRTLQRSEHCAPCAGLCNGLNTVRLVQDFATNWTLCGLSGLCNGLNTVRLVQDFAMDWTLCGLCRTLQRTEHFAACAGLCNGLNTMRLRPLFAGSSLCYLSAWSRAFRQIVKHCSGRERESERE